MAFSVSFLSKRAEVPSDRLLGRIDDMLYTIEQMPGVGSSLAASSLRNRYGPSILKALVSPYLIIYQHDRTTDTVYVYDLVDARSIH